MNFEEAKSKTATQRKYQVTGKRQIRFETLFTENEIACVAECFDLNEAAAGIRIEDFKQTSDALLNTLSADLTTTIEKLLLQLGEREYLLHILNFEEIWENWETKKRLLVEKYADIPDFETVCDNFGENLRNEEKLLTSIRDKGVYGLLFPQLKHFAYGRIPETFERRKVFREYAFEKDLAVAEKISVTQDADSYLFEVRGELDKDNFDYPGFLHVIRQMFGGQVVAADLVFESSANYSLDKTTLQYSGGARRHYFEIKNSYFSDDRQEFKLKADG